MELDSTVIKTRNLGMGHGDGGYREPDARLRAGTNLTDVVVVHHGDADQESDGDLCVVEAKSRYSSGNLPQIVSQSIVSSLVERNHHPDLNSLIPSILLNTSFFKVVVYNCNLDVLLLSSDIEYREQCDEIKEEGVLMLWMVINHR